MLRKINKKVDCKMEVDVYNINEFLKYFNKNIDEDELEELIEDEGEWNLMERLLQEMNGEYGFELFLDDDDNYENDYATIYIFETDLELV